MSDRAFEFSIQGDQSGSTNQELSTLLQDVFTDWPLQKTTKPVESPGEARTRTDPVTVAALVLAVPGAILATWDLAQRIELKKKVERLIDWARRKKKENPTLVITLTLSGIRVKYLDRTEPEEILDALAEWAEKDSPKSDQG